jgi:hypothetical protein
MQLGDRSVALDRRGCFVNKIPNQGMDRISIGRHKMDLISIG